MGCRRITYDPLQNAAEANPDFFLSSRGKTEPQAKNRLNTYAFGFNGQEKDDEWKGSGNSFTAEFWQYDARLGRRWNLDPKPNSSVSQYAAFANNPIWLYDPPGDTV